MATWLLFLVAALSLVRRARCTAGDVCYILGANTAILEDRLFYTNGNYSVVTYDGQEFSTSASLYSLNLTADFPVERTIPQSSFDNYSISSSDSIFNNGGNTGGALWYTNDTMYLFGGVESPTNTLSSYNVTTGTWRDVQVAGGDFNFGNRSGVSAVSVPYYGLSFASGGHTPYTGPSMLRFDASDPDKLSWANETLGNGSYGIEVPNLDSGAMVYLPAGEQGVLVNFGGGNVTDGISPDSGWPYPAYNSIIYIYDIASHTWWAQESTGDIPPLYLGQSCAGVAISPDYGAFHITTYGGWSLLDGRSYETVYTLSIPSFTWTNVTSTSDKTNMEQQVNSTIGRDSPSCQVYNGAQLITMGGTIRSGAYSLTNGACSQVFEPLRVLDLSTYTWQSTSFDPTITYRVPVEISNVIGGNATGGATKTQPSGGWADPTLASIMQKRVPRVTSASSSGPTSTSTATSSASATGSPGDAHRSDTGAIAGGVVGGLIGLLILAGLAWFFLRRRRSRGKGQSRGSSDTDSRTPFEMEARHLGEMHGDDRPLEAESRPVHELLVDPQELYGTEVPRKETSRVPTSDVKPDDDQKSDGQ